MKIDRAMEACQNHSQNHATKAAEWWQGYHPFQVVDHKACNNHFCWSIDSVVMFCQCYFSKLNMLLFPPTPKSLLGWIFLTNSVTTLCSLISSNIFPTIQISNRERTTGINYSICEVNTKTFLQEKKSCFILTMQKHLQQNSHFLE